MTLEEIIKKMDKFNDLLDNYITEVQSNPMSFDLVQLKNRAGAIERIVFNDPEVQRILANAEENTAERQQYFDAIKEGTKKTTDLLEQFKTTETDISRKKTIEKVQGDANVSTKNIIEGIEELEAPASPMRLNDDERKKDLLNKIETTKNGMKISEKFYKIRKSLADDGRDQTAEEAIDEVESIIDDFKVYKANLENLKFENGNLYEKLEEYKQLKNEGKSHNDPKIQEVLVQLMEVAQKTDEVDNYGKDINILAATALMPDEKELGDYIKVGKWIADLENKTKEPELLKKMNGFNEFLEKGKKGLDEKIIKKIKKSPVLKHLDSPVQEGKPVDISAIETFLSEVKRDLEAYKKIKFQKPADLKRYIADAEKLYESYEIATSNHNQVSINGKTKDLTADGVDMTDKDKADKALDVIKTLNEDDEFKKEFDAKVEEEVQKALMAYPKPEYGRIKSFLYKLRKIVTFGLVKTPEEKYDMFCYNTKKEKELRVTEDIIDKNATKVNEANEQVKNDKDLYNKIAIQKIIKSKQKLNKKDKTKILNQREANNPLTR